MMEKVNYIMTTQEKFETTGAGVTVTGVTTSRGFVVEKTLEFISNNCRSDDVDAILRESSSNITY